MADDNSGPGQRALWIVIGAILTGVVAIPMSWVTQVATPKAPFAVSITTSIDPLAGDSGLSFTHGGRQYALLTGERYVIAKLHNSSNHIAAKDVDVRISASSAGAFFQLITRTVDAQCKGRPDSGFDVIMSCSLINPLEDRFLEAIVEKFPEQISVYLGYDGYSINRTFVRDKCVETQINDLGFKSDNACYVQSSP